jgi:hypothetical protein
MMRGRWRRWLNRLAVTAVIGAAIVGTALWTRGLDVRWHWSSSGPGQISDASAALAESLDGTLTLTAAVPAEHFLRRHIKQLAAAYRRHHADVELSFLDPKTDPKATRKQGLQRTGEILVGYRGRHELVKVPSEARLSAAIERLLRSQDAFVAYLTGHGERSLEGQANFDLGQFGKALSRRGHRLQPLSIARTPVIPDNTALLIVAQPRADFMPGERQLLADYVKRGGNLLWLTEPDAPGNWPSALGVKRIPGVVVDPQAKDLLAVDDPRLLLLDGNTDHPATTSLDAPLLLAQAAALQPGEGSSKWQVHALLRTAGRDWADSDYDPAASPVHAEAEPTGPLNVGLTLSRRTDSGTQRIAVIGDADFLSNTYLGNGGNLAFGLNLVEWLTSADQFVSRYTAAAPDQRLDYSRAEILGIGFGSLFVVPGLLLLGAGWAWQRRRRG